MRRAVFAMALLGGIAAAPALAEAPTGVETVIVNASALNGIWRISMPESGSITTSGSHWGPMRDVFCRMESRDGETAIHCLSAAMSRNGTVEVDGNTIHMAWGWMMLRTVFDGTLQSDSQFRGVFAVKLSGIRYDAPTPSLAVKLALSPDTPDGGGKSALLTRVLPAMAAGQPTAALGLPATAPLDAETLHRLGPVQSAIYLGTAAHPDQVTVHAYLSVYDVEFAGGQRLCGLHQKPDGTVDRFVCL